MKIRKIAEYTEKGTKEKFEIVWAKEEEGWELTGEEMRVLRELLNSALGTAPLFYIPKINIVEDFIDDVEAAVEKYGEDVVFPEPIFEDEDCPDKIEPPAPEVVCENGACRLVIPEEEEAQVEIPEEKKPEPLKKERKKPGRKTNRDYSKYIVMKAEGHPIKDIKRAMADDLGVSIQSAENYYYAHVKNAVAPEQGPAVIEKEKKELLKEIEPKVKQRKKTITPLEADIARMPHYHNQRQFKDACAAADIGRGKISIGALKALYLESHPTVRW